MNLATPSKTIITEISPTERLVSRQRRFFKICPCGIRHTALVEAVQQQRFGPAYGPSYGPGKPREIAIDLRTGLPSMKWQNHGDERSGGEIYYTCQCGRDGILMAVAGRVNADKKCDSRCTDAKGFSCECSCGGKNHGAGDE